MLSVEDNVLVSRVGPGTPMGTLMREYWIPAMLSSELPTPDCDPVRVLLLCEQLIAFRDTSGRVGLIQNLCPHRGASLFFGRNEENGIRCVYHGWKYDVTGACVDMPNEPPESNFKSRIKAAAYPCQERGGIVWTYMGPKEVPPPLPPMTGNELPEGEYTATVVQRECNWLQALEGEFDTSHTNFLHTGSLRKEEFPEGSIWYYALKDRSPRITAVDTDYGVIYGAHRPAGPGETYWRVSQFLLPFFVHIVPDGTRAWVPMDDYHVLSVNMNAIRPRRVTPASTTDSPEALQRARGGGVNPREIPLQPNTTDWHGRFRPQNQIDNDFLIDRAEQRSGRSFTGIPGGFGPQDQAVTVSMGPILNRNNEHLGTADTMVIQSRRRLIEAAIAVSSGKGVAPGADDPEVFRTRAAGRIIMPESAGLMDVAAELERKPVIADRDQEIPWSQVDRT